MRFMKNIGRKNSILPEKKRDFFVSYEAIYNCKLNNTRQVLEVYQNCASVRVWYLNIHCFDSNYTATKFLMRMSKMHMLKCMQLDQYIQKWPQELHKTWNLPSQE